MIILKVTKNQCFTLSLEDKFSKNHRGESNILRPAVLELIFYHPNEKGKNP